MNVRREIEEFRRTQQEATVASDIVTSGEKLFRHLRREFRARFARDLPRPVILPRSPVCAVWRDARGQVGNVQVVAYLSPWRFNENRPLITRITVNHYGVRVSRANLKRLGCTFSQTLGQTASDPHLELSTVPEELLDFAPWIAAFVESHDIGTELAAPPHPCNFFGGDMHTSSYAWTCTAQDEAWAYQAKEEEIRQRQLARWRESKTRSAV